MKKKTLKRVGLLCLICIAAAAFIAYRLYNKPHRSVTDETAITVSAVQLAGDYEKDEAASNKKYLGNALQVSGTVSEVSVNQQGKTVVLFHGSDMSGIQCTFLENTSAVKKGDSVSIKGFCTGFLTDVILDRCMIAH